MNLFLYQLKQAYLSLKKKPGFVFSVASTMGITLGALLCVATLAYVMLIKPLPYPEQDKLYHVTHTLMKATGEQGPSAFTYPGIKHLYKHQSVFDQSALLVYDQGALTSLPHQPIMSTTYVTPDLFPLLGATFILGQGFEQTEAIDSNNPVAILSYKTWREEFAQDVDILSKKVSFHGVSFRVIGVLSESFIEPEINTIGVKTDVWLPWDFDPDNFYHDRWQNISFKLTYIGKLKAGVSVNQAQSSMTPLVNNIWQENVAGIEFFNGFSIKIELQAFKKVILGESYHAIYLLLAGVIGLVIIAFANITNLFISRTAELQQQLAIHAALGATKSQLFNALFAQSGILMLLSMLVALKVAFAGFALSQYYLSNILPRVDELAIDIFTLTLALTLLFLFAYLFALFSTRMITYRTLNLQLQSSGKGSGSQVSKNIRNLLIISQVAIASTLIFINLNLFKEAVATIKAPLGFELDNSYQLTLTSLTTDSPREEISAVMTEIRTKLLQLPQIKSVSQSESPLSRFGETAIIVEHTNERFNLAANYVDDQYFQLIRQVFIEGNDFSHADFQQGNDVIIINDVLAEKLAKKGTALGVKVKLYSGAVATVIAVVKGIKLPGESDIPMRYYELSSTARTNWMIKLKDDQQISRKQLVSLIQAVNSQYIVNNFESLADTSSKRLFSTTVTAVTTLGLTILTWFLAGIGLYGILSYSTQSRRFEIGTRLSIGAKGKDIIALVIKDNAKALLSGVISSLLILLTLSIGLNGSLGNYFNLDLLAVLLITLAVISLVSFIACYLPLRQYISKPAIACLRGSD